MSSFQKRTAAALRDQLTLMGQRRLPSNADGFDDEFDSLRALDYQVRSNRDEFYTASLGSNLSKNRFRDVLPNEGTRVILDPINHRGDGDYINANYIDARRLFGVPFVYIATQAPLRSTVCDFWRMVYENNTTFIVMLCAEIEAGKQKSERYWPDAVGEVMALGPLNVVLINENHRADTIYRTVALRTLEGKERRVHHLQYTRWPDQSIPGSSSGLMEVILTLGRSPLSTQTPIVVHCSGGVGRTGVFLTLHIAMALFELEQPISVPRIVQYLKYCRSGMVQRKDQYLFCYYAILREMEKMVWSVEAMKHVDSKMIPIPENVVTGRRPNEFLPSHPAQVRPDMQRSALQPLSVGSSHLSGGAYSSPSQREHLPPHHGIHVTTDAAGNNRRGGAAGRALVPDPDNVEEQLEHLRMQNQVKRRTLAAGGSGGSGGGGGSSFQSSMRRGATIGRHDPSEAKLEPLHGRTPISAGGGYQHTSPSAVQLLHHHQQEQQEQQRDDEWRGQHSDSDRRFGEVPHQDYMRGAPEPSPGLKASPIPKLGNAAAAAREAGGGASGGRIGEGGVGQPPAEGAAAFSSPASHRAAADHNYHYTPPASAAYPSPSPRYQQQQQQQQQEQEQRSLHFSDERTGAGREGTKLRDHSARPAPQEHIADSDLGSAASAFNANFLKAAPRRNDFAML